MTPGYASIDDHQIATNPSYSLAEHSPGFRAVLEHTQRLTRLSGRALDVGCGAGFVVELLRSPPFWFDAFGVDVPRFCDELRRVCRPGGLVMCSVAMREASAVDQHGDNLHRTVRPFDRWTEHVRPVEAHWVKNPAQAICWHTRRPA